MEKANQTVAHLAEENEFYALLEQLLEEQHLSAKIICEGICSESMLSKSKCGHRMPNKMMRDRLFDRLGMSDERNENLLCYEDYVKWKKRQDILKCVWRKELSKARGLLKEYAKSEGGEGKIEQQFYHAMEIQLLIYEENVKDSDNQETTCGQEASSAKNRIHLRKQLEKAVKLTVPRIGQKKICELLLSVQELNLILEYENYRDAGCFVERCDELLQYVDQSFMDVRNKAKIYPKIVWLQCRELFQRENVDYPKIMKKVNCAIDCLRATEKSHYLWELLSLKEEVLEKWQEKLEAENNTAQANALLRMWRENREWKEAIEAIYGMCGQPPQTDNYCYMYMQQDVYCINEVMRCRREMFGISRVKLNADSFDIKTIIRMETKNAKTQMAIVRELFARLNLSGELQRVDVIAGCREARDLLEKLVKYSNDFDLANEEKTLGELEKYLSMDIPLNRQFLKKAQAILIYGKGKQNRDKALEVMKEALECTVSFTAIQKAEKIYLTGGEISCLHNMAVYAGNHTLNPYHEVLLKICRQYELAGEVEEHIDMYMWIMTAIAKVFGKMGEYEYSSQIAKSVLREGLRCGRIIFAAQNMNTVSWNMLQMQKNCTFENSRCNRETDLKRCISISRFCKNISQEKNYMQRLGKYIQENQGR